VLYLFGKGTGEHHRLSSMYNVYELNESLECHMEEQEHESTDYEVRSCDGDGTSLVVEPRL
jgi:hypothetical protein